MGLLMFLIGEMQDMAYVFLAFDKTIPVENIIKTIADVYTRDYIHKNH